MRPETGESRWNHPDSAFDFRQYFHFAKKILKDPKNGAFGQSKKCHAGVLELGEAENDPKMCPSLLPLPPLCNLNQS
jgi:hypothetical protein